MTDKQQAVLDFIHEHIETEQHWPTMEDIAARFGWSSPNSALHHVEALARKGWLRRSRGRYVIPGARLVVMRDTA